MTVSRFSEDRQLINTRPLVGTACAHLRSRCESHASPTKPQTTRIASDQLATLQSIDPPSLVRQRSERNTFKRACPRIEASSVALDRACLGFGMLPRPNSSHPQPVFDPVRDTGRSQRRRRKNLRKTRTRKIDQTKILVKRKMIDWKTRPPS
jgi:hypothetical protein